MRGRLHFRDGTTRAVASRYLRPEWDAGRYLPFGIASFVLSAVVVVAYYVNNPATAISPDTDIYLQSAHRILHSGQLVDLWRPPGYPLFIAAVFLVAGEGNLQALSIAQGALFVVAAVEVFVIVSMITRRAWIAFVVSLLVGTNTYQLSFVKADIVEGFALWVVVSLALATVLFVQFPRPRLLWLVAFFALLAFMTRPEWLLVVVPLLAFMLIAARGRSETRGLVYHAAAAVLVLHAIAGAYSAANAVQNHYFGLSVVQRINLFGKVIQYRMQDEAPVRFAVISAQLDAYLARLDRTPATDSPGPYVFGDQHPELSANNWQLANEYATATAKSAPFEYFRKSASIFLHENNNWPYKPIRSDGRFGGTLESIEELSRGVQDRYLLFPAVAVGWIALWIVTLIRRSRLPAERISMMAGVCLLGLYDLSLVSLGAYTDYPRLHVPLNPLRIVVLSTTLLLLVAAAYELGAWLALRPTRRRKPT